MRLVQEISKDAVRAVIYKLLKLMGDTEGIIFGEVRISYALVYRDGKPQYLKCCDPHENSIDLREFPNG